jgi:hypothetical protein
MYRLPAVHNAGVQLPQLLARLQHESAAGASMQHAAATGAVKPHDVTPVWGRDLVWIEAALKARPLAVLSVPS